jgi:hypothetical protein
MADKTEYDWPGYDRQRSSRTSGWILCRTCGERWLVRSCWLAEPSRQCIAVLQLHRADCPADGFPLRGILEQSDRQQQHHQADSEER